jgi:membrane-associated protease RseP (regulator of RpoE activity)
MPEAPRAVLTLVYAALGAVVGAAAFFVARLAASRLLRARAVAAAAGPVAAYAVVAAMASVALAAGGEPTIDEASLRVQVMPGGPAAAAGMRSGDRVVSVAGMTVGDWASLRDEVAEHPGQSIPVVVDRGGEDVTLAVAPTGDPPRIQVGPYVDRSGLSALRAMRRGVKWPVIAHVRSARAIVRALRGSDDGEVAGPVAMLAPPGHGERLLAAATVCGHLLWIPLALSLVLLARRPRPA